MSSFLKPLWKIQEMGFIWSLCYYVMLLYYYPMHTHAAERYPFILEASSSASTLKGYDYIVVGGGTAGCALAATLSQHFKVLVLERGGSPYSNLTLTRIENVLTNLRYRGEAFVSTEGIPNVRAKVLGGGSSINGGFYSRASVEYIRQAGLGGRLVNASYEWVERVVASIPQQISPYQEAIRRSLLEVGVTPDNGATYDHRFGTKIGGTIFDDQGNRRPASDLFYYANPNNIQVLLHATVQRILFKGWKRKAYGVIYTDPLGHNHTAILNARLQSEIILSAGALGSPQLLLLSGVGPADHLQAMGIKVVMNLPGVGKEMADNPQAAISLSSPSSFGTLEPVVGVTSNGNIIERTPGRIAEKVIGPLSTGELFLRTLNVSDNPIVTFNYFKEPQDLETCVAGVNILEEMLLSTSLRPFLFDNQTLPSGGTISSPDRRNATYATTAAINNTIANFCKERLRTFFHYHGGCRIGKVLDNKFRVLGVTGLRVVDGSTFKFTPGTNPQATVMMLGRYMGLKIIKENRRTHSPAKPFH